MPPYLEERIAGRSWGVGRCNPGQSHFSESVRAARRTLILSVIAVALLVSRSTAVSPMGEVRRVLIINDLGVISSPGFSEVIQAVLTGLQKSPYRIELYEESLDLTLFPDRVSQDRFREEIIQKYSARKPDVIIAAGPGSLKFIANLYDKFQGTPIIFCAIWGGIPDQLRQGMPFTGVLAQLHPEETLNAALHLLPSTKHVVVVGGVGKFDEGFEAIAKQSFHNYESKLEFTYLFDLTMPALLERLKHLPNDTIVYHTAISQDAAGDRFIDSAQSIPMVASAANAPVFVMDDVDLRAGTVGGDLVNWTDDGRIAAEMAARVLNGEKPQDIPVVTSNHAYMFDWPALKRWGMNEKNLPPGSIVLNRQLTLWESHKWYIISGVSLIFLEALLIGGLVWQRARRRKVETDLAVTYDRLRLAVEAGKSVGWDWDVQSGRDQWFGDLQTMFGIPADSYSGHVEDFRRSIHPDDRELVWKAVADARQSREPYIAEFRVVRADGTMRWITARGKFYYVPNGDPVRMLGMAVDITERKLAEAALANVSRKLIEAQEQERSRIGRELHDDIGQRLALLAIQLQQLHEDPLVLPEVSTRMGELKKETSEIANDIQFLSHELHSTKLQYLGVAGAMRGFCQEFGEQQKVEIDFQSHDLPSPVPPDTALCLFRVLQEALHNSVKHSGVRHIEVRLWGTSGEIQLTVKDSGAGFDREAAKTSRGIGLISMEERLKLVDGTLSIESQPKSGTTIHARVPLRSGSDSMRAAG